MLSGVSSENVHLLEDTHWLHKLNTLTSLKVVTVSKKKS